ncbi:hypothetical protein GX865_04135 [Candidatus Saccharibacteria bacterium]|jgi:hypothetical protein|nr:hypothetical protein [Candidatus Saccharibacteria bacterium]
MNESILDWLKKINIKYLSTLIALIALIVFFVNYAVIVISVTTPNNLPKVTPAEKMDHHYGYEEGHSHNNEEGVHYTDNIIDDKYKEKDSVDVSISYDNVPKDIGRPGIHIVKRGVNGVRVKTVNSATSSIISIPWYGFLYKKLDIKIDKNADKLSYRSTLRNPCGSYNEKSNQIIQYDCSKPTSLSVYETPYDKKWKARNIANIDYQKSTLAHYMGGLLGVDRSAKDSKKIIRHLSIDGTIRSLNQPDGTNCSQSVCIAGSKSEANKFLLRHPNSAKIFTDTKNQNNSNFIFVTSNGDINLGKVSSIKKINYKKVEHIEEYDPGSYQTLCDINNSKAICYQGVTLDAPVKKTTSSPSPSYLLSINFDSDKVERFKLRDNLALSYIGITTDDSIFAKELNSIIQLRIKSNKKIEEVPIADNIDKVSAGSDLYYTYDKGVFKLETKTLDSYQIFNSGNIHPDKLITTDKSVVILGNSPRGYRGLTYAWKLNQEDNLNPGLRIIDRLPGHPLSVAFGKTDLVGDMIYIQPTIDRGTPISKTENEKKRIIKNLRTSGIDTDKFKIITAKN